MTGSTRITLIRHAESCMNRHSRLVGGRSNQTPLTHEGTLAAAEFGRRLASQLRPTVLAHTSAVRSRQTIEAIVAAAGWRGIPVVLEDGLIELAHGVAEGQPRSRWWAPEALAAMHRNPLHFRLAAGGESHREVQLRMRNALHRLAGHHPGGHVVAVGHGNAIRTLVWSLQGGDHTTFRALAMPNLGRVDLEVSQDRIQLT